MRKTRDRILSAAMTFLDANLNRARASYPVQGDSVFLVDIDQILSDRGATTMGPLALLILKEFPVIFAGVREMWKAAHPTEPLPSEEEMLAAFQDACRSSIAKDDAWLAAHRQ